MPEDNENASIPDDAVAKASDVFKLIATTALGFLFGRNSK